MERDNLRYQIIPRPPFRPNTIVSNPGTSRVGLVAGWQLPLPQLPCAPYVSCAKGRIMSCEGSGLRIDHPGDGIPWQIEIVGEAQLEGGFGHVLRRYWVGRIKAGIVPPDAADARP